MSIHDFSNMSDIIDSRDVISRIDELSDEAEENPEDLDVREELAHLHALQDEAEGYAADWQHGEALIRDSYFETYARQLAEDIGALENTDQWPGRCIDWEKAAEELQQDYTSVDFDGVEYWIR